MTNQVSAPSAEATLKELRESLIEAVRESLHTGGSALYKNESLLNCDECGRIVCIDGDSLPHKDGCMVGRWEAALDATENIRALLDSHAAKAVARERERCGVIYRADVETMLIRFRNILNEIDCRIEHGANSGGHLEYVRKVLTAAIRETQLPTLEEVQAIYAKYRRLNDENVALMERLP